MIKTIIKTSSPFVKIAFWTLCVTYTIAPLYEKFLVMASKDAYNQPGGVESWMLGDIAAIFTIGVYVAMYATVETCVKVFGVDDHDKKAEAQNKAQDKTSDKDLSEA